jgi:hypothetical protein
MKQWHKLAVGAALLTVVSGFGVAAASPNHSQPAGPHVVRPLMTPLDTSVESKFTPITPCRIVDTRLTGARVTPGLPRDFHARGTMGFVGQGGKSGGCGVPTAATSIQVTLTSVNALGTGFLRTAPFGQPVPNATFLNYTNTLSLGTGGTVTLSPSGSTKDFTLASFFKATHVVVDVTGYYIAPIWARVNAGTTPSIVAGSRFTGVTNLGVGTTQVDFDRNIASCSYDATPFFTGFTIEVQPRSGDVNGVFVFTTTAAGAAAYVPFYLTVIC